MIKIDIFSGFLGAGKTTLIKKLIQEAYRGEQVVLIENEFGEIGVDGGFLQDAGIQITEMNSGCICCTLVGDFAKALREVAARYSPDRIIIEPSGVGKLSDVIRAVRSAGVDCCASTLTSPSSRLTGSSSPEKICSRRSSARIRSPQSLRSLRRRWRKSIITITTGTTIVIMSMKGTGNETKTTMGNTMPTR